MHKILIFSLLFLAACTFSQLEPREEPEICETIEVTYDLNIRAIIDTKCAYVGCHVAGFSSGDYSTYEGMISRLDDGEISKRTIEIRDMPPVGSPDMTEDEIDLLDCWIASGFPRN